MTFKIVAESGKIHVYRRNFSYVHLINLNASVKLQLQLALATPQLGSTNTHIYRTYIHTYVDVFAYGNIRKYVLNLNCWNLVIYVPMTGWLAEWLITRMTENVITGV